MKQGAALAAIVRTAKMVPYNAKDVEKERSAINVSSLEADKYLKKLFGIESEARKELTREKEKLERRSEELATLQAKQHNYPLVSLDGLTHRTKEGWPSVAIFSLNSPNFTIKVRAGQANLVRSIESFDDEFRMAVLRTLTRSELSTRTSITVTPKLPKQFTAHYKDVFSKLRTIARKRNKDVTLSASFSGLIPLEVKEKIVEAQKVFPQIFILAEPQGWSLKAKARVIPKEDPLVVGWDGEHIYLIAEFDTTPVEEAILLEGPANKFK